MEQIEKLRTEMHELLSRLGINDSRVLAKSRELDIEINRYYRV